MADQDDTTVENNSKFKAISGGKFKFARFSEVKIDRDRRDLIKGILPQTGIVVVWGPPKCGKSFWIADLLLHACQGWLYRGRKTQPGGIAYYAFEGQGGIPPRIEALRQRYLPNNPDIPFYICRDVIDIIKDHRAMLDMIRQLPTQRVNVVVLDTLNKSLFGSENKDEDMSAYIRAADAIVSALKCVVIIVHHCGTAGTRPRGHTALTGAVDVQIKVTRKQRTVTTEIELAKDGESGTILVSTLEKVLVGHDIDGEPIHTMLIVPADPETTRNERLDKIAPKAKRAYEALCKLIEKEGQKVPSETPNVAGSKGVTIERFREILAKDEIVHEKGNPRQELKRILVTLKSAGLADTSDELVWASQTP